MRVGVSQRIAFSQDKSAMNNLSLLSISKGKIIMEQSKKIWKPSMCTLLYILYSLQVKPTNLIWFRRRTFLIWLIPFCNSTFSKIIIFSFIITFIPIHTHTSVHIDIILTFFLYFYTFYFCYLTNYFATPHQFIQVQ